MKNKSINQVSIINGEDGPTSVFIFGEAQKQSLKIRIRNAIYQSRRKRIEKRIAANPHTLAEVVQYAKDHYDLDSGCQYRNNNYYYNKDGVPFLSKEQADRCINGKDWKKIVSVSDKVKSDLEKVVKQDFISSNGAYIPEESKRHDVIKQYLNTIPSEQRNSASWTLSRMAGDYASRMETLVKKNNPGWKPGDAFDTSILDQMDDTLGGLDFKV